MAITAPVVMELVVNNSIYTKKKIPDYMIHSKSLV